MVFWELFVVGVVVFVPIVVVPVIVLVVEAVDAELLIGFSAV